jgi:choline dehydrogenase-like flavoprotein
MDEVYDYVIVGAGPGGCVLANRLSADPKVRVALVETGPENRNFFIDMPKGFGRLLTMPKYLYYYPIEASAASEAGIWARGKTLGGSTSVNGMAYSRGQPEDFDRWEQLGAKGWNWKALKPAFKAIEDHELGEDDLRGSGGPLHVSVNPTRDPVSDAILKAAGEVGLPVRDDVNREDQEGIGPMGQMIKNGQRMSAADAFLKPVRKRPNLSVFTDTLARKIVFEGKRAVGVACSHEGITRTLRANREVLLCAGAFESPKLLMLSGIGPADHLAEHGIDVLVDSPGVGDNLYEHRGIALQYRLKGGYSQNREYSGLRLVLNVMRYLMFRRGLMSTTAHGLMGFAKALPQSSTADTQMFIGPFSRDLGARTLRFEKEPGVQCLIYPSRPTSTGTLRLRSTDAADFPVLRPEALSTDYDRAVSIAMVHYVRKLFAAAPIGGMIAEETFPGPGVETDEEILQAIRESGTWGYHTCGTARMGADGDRAAVLDDQLRVRGVEALRVVDASAFPCIVAANTTAPVAAMAWRTASIISGSNV